MKYRHQVVIDCPQAQVFAYMDDVEREKDWQPKIKEASKDPPGVTAVGTRKRYVSEFLGRPVRNTYVTRVFEPNDKVVYETTADSVMKARVEITFEAEGAGTRVSMEVEAKPTGALRFLPKTVLEGTAKKELGRSLALLKTELER